MVVAPAGTINAGTVYVATSSTESPVIVIKPDGTVTPVNSGETLIKPIVRLAVAPFGTPNAGTVYVDSGGSQTQISQINTDLSVTAVATIKGVNNEPVTSGLAVAPSDSSRPGSLYVLNHDIGRGTSVTIISPTGKIDTVEVPPGPLAIVATPAGIPNASAVHLLTVAGSQKPLAATLTTIDSDESTRSTAIDVADRLATLAIAPPGIPGAGTIYINLGTGIETVGLDGSVSSAAEANGSLVGLAVAPTGASNAGVVYSIDLPPDAGKGLQSCKTGRHRPDL